MLEFSYKIMDLDAAGKKLAEVRADHKIVWTNGCFDLVHMGHLDYLFKARQLGDLLIIGLNSDQSVKRIKGPNRPIIDQSSRAALLASLYYVDIVTIFEEDNPLNCIETITPDILVKGADYENSVVVGADWVRQHGGSIELIDLLEGYSSSGIIKRIRTRYD